MSVKERLKTYLKSNNVTQSDFANAIKASSGYVNAIRKSISPDKIIMIEEKYPDLNMQWLIFNKGEMLKSTVAMTNHGDSLLKQGIGVIDKKKRLDNVTPVPNENYMWVEYADLSVAAGELGGNNVDELPETKKRLVPKEYENGEYLVIRVDGDSMDDGTKYSIPDGTEILIKKYYYNVGDKLPIRNNLFVINAREGKALKQLIEHNLEENYIVCHSYNSEFKDYKLEMEDILEIFIYRKIVSSRPPIPDIN